jgi:hypothetical protein
MTRPFLNGRQRGQAMIEYVVIGSVLVSALFIVDIDGKTGAQYLADMFKAFFRNFSYYLSLP